MSSKKKLLVAGAGLAGLGAIFLASRKAKAAPSQQKMAEEDEEEGISVTSPDGSQIIISAADSDTIADVASRSPGVVGPIKTDTTFPGPTNETLEKILKEQAAKAGTQPNSSTTPAPTASSIEKIIREAGQAVKDAQQSGVIPTLISAEPVVITRPPTPVVSTSPSQTTTSTPVAKTPVSVPVPTPELDKIINEAVDVVTGGKGPAPIADAETSPELDPYGTVLLARLMLARENAPDWKGALKPQVKAWQARVGLKADGLYGPKSAARMAEEVGILPLVRYWSKNTPSRTVADAGFSVLIDDVIKDLMKHLPDSAAHITALEASKNRETAVSFSGNPPAQNTAQFAALTTAELADSAQAIGKQKVLNV